MILAVDGGGTKTKVLVANMEGVIVGEATAGPSSIDTVSIVTSVKNIKEAISSIGDYTFEKVFLGLGGVSSKRDSALVIDQLRKEKEFTKAKIICENDVVNAYYAALKDQPGMVLIVGTGSVCYGEGEYKHRSGGYGHFEGDPGSAYYLGRQLIKSIAKSLDGRITKSGLIHEVMKDYKIKSNIEYIQFIKDMYQNRTNTAALATYVTKHASVQDRHACHIIEEACKELVMMIESVGRNIHSSSKEVYVVGSLGLDDYFFKRLKEQLRKCGNYTLHKSSKEPVYGALFAAKRL